jgi:hypothetical protein
VSLECNWCGQPKDWLTTAEAAAFLGIPRRSLTRACREGLIPGAKLVKTTPQASGSYRVPASVVSALAGSASAEEAAGTASTQ